MKPGNAGSSADQRRIDSRERNDQRAAGLKVVIRSDARLAPEMTTRDRL